MIFNVKFTAGNKQTPIHIQFEGAEIKKSSQDCEWHSDDFSESAKVDLLFRKYPQGF